MSFMWILCVFIVSVKAILPHTIMVSYMFQSVKMTGNSTNMYRLIALGDKYTSSDILGKFVSSLEAVLVQNGTNISNTNSLWSQVFERKGERREKFTDLSINNMNFDIFMSCNTSLELFGSVTNTMRLRKYGQMCDLTTEYTNVCFDTLEHDINNENTTDSWLSCAVRDGELQVTIMGSNIESFENIILSMKVELAEPSCNFENGECSWKNNSMFFKEWPFYKTENHTDVASYRLIQRTIRKNIKEENFAIAVKSNRSDHISAILSSPTIVSSGPTCTINLRIFHCKHTGYLIKVITDQSTEWTLAVQRSERSCTTDTNQWEELSFLIGRINEPFRVELFLFIQIPIRFIAVHDIAFANCSKVDGYKEKCNPGEFQCSTGICIPHSLTCNLQINCLYGEDESKELCGHPEFKTCDFERSGSCDIIEDLPKNCYRIAEAAAQNASQSFMLVDHTTNSRTGNVLFIDLNQKRCKGFRTVHLPPVSPEVIYNQTCKMTFSYFAEDGDNPHGRYHINIISNLFQDRKPIKSYRTGTGQNIKNRNSNEWKTESFSLANFTSSFLGYYWKFHIISTTNVKFYIDDIVISRECYGYEQIEQEKDSTTESVDWSTIKGRERQLENQMHLVIPLVAVVTFLLSAVAFIFIAYNKRLIFCKPSVLWNSSTAVPFSSILESPEMVNRLNDCILETNPGYEWFNPRTFNETIQSIPRSRLTLIRLIGDGAFGEVFKATLSQPTANGHDIQVAVKKLPMNCSEQAKMDFLFEALTLSKFKHANIVDCLGISTDGGDLLLIQELMYGGDMKTFLREARPSQDTRPVTTSELTSLALDIAKGCWYLEDNKFIHRDIAARNCLLTSTGPSRIAKIGDFGMARDVVISNYYKRSGRAMLPVRWMPPEAIQDGLFSSKSDVWAFGVLLWEIYSFGHMPYPGLTNNEVIDLVPRGERLAHPGECPKELYGIMQDCWDPLPGHRPSFQMLKQRIDQIRKSFLPPVTSERLRVRFQKQRLNSYDCTDDAPLLTKKHNSDSNHIVHQLTTVKV